MALLVVALADPASVSMSVSAAPNKNSDAPDIMDVLSLREQDSFSLAKLATDEWKELSQNVQALRILQNHIKSILRKNLLYIHTEYINNSTKLLEEIKKEMPESEKNKIDQMTEMCKLLTDLVEIKHALMRLLTIEKESFDHPFVEMDNPLLSGILYKLNYVDANGIKEIAEFYKAASDMVSNTNKGTLLHIASLLSNLLDCIQSLEKLAEDAKEMSDLDALMQKCSKLPNLMKAVDAIKNQKMREADAIKDREMKTAEEIEDHEEIENHEEEGDKNEEKKEEKGA
jgi:hypothetical protein